MLTLQNISFQVDSPDGTVGIVRDLSLTVEAGKLLVITGPNGGGKSTLAKLIMGIEKPTGGKIIYEGRDITGLLITERARIGIGYAFQQPPRFKGVTVRKLLELSRGEEMSDDALCKYLSGVGLCSREYLGREVDSSLSGGELKRIEIASLMARAPKLSIYDEPEAGIDLWSFAMLVDSFSALRTGSDKSVVIISHQERIIRLADEIAIIADGRIQKMGPRDEILPDLLGEVSDVCCMEKKEAARV